MASRHQLHNITYSYGAAGQATNTVAWLIVNYAMSVGVAGVVLMQQFCCCIPATIR
jgi:hypothetical protein